jgi:prevent-host-death family protein
MPTSKSQPVEVIPAAEANRRFSELLRGVREEGKTFTITSHGRAVAQIRPPDEDEAQAARDAAWEALKARLSTSQGVEIKPWTREELYDRGRKD